ncbi:class I adenylate-forming enzyme family protein [Lactiplantibacillus plajomi]|uniref:Class I adenylate-forming enzyme family protein n=1 Tax=Lactiplantibacillus plajomi TaxID=1457217 RepID=A0ABV6K683_9LACO|nr:class I adenylate-forming enzyme family protein [Lactiplantibacillus plajomi]
MTNSNSLHLPNAFPMTIAAVWRKRCMTTPNQTFLIQDRQRLTYREVDQLSDQAVTFLDQLRVKNGDVVAIQMATSITAIQLMLACIKQGITILPLNPHLDPDEAQALVDRMQPTLMITQSDGRNSLSLNCPVGYQQQTVRLSQVPLQAMQRRQRPRIAASVKHPAVIMCTSGTTSFSKGVILSDQNILYSELQFNRIYGITADDVLVLPSGMYHAIGFHHGLVSTMLAGSTMVLMRRYSVAGLKKAILTQHCTYLVTVPTVIYDVLGWFKRPSDLRFIVSGGSPLSDGLIDRAKKVQLPVYNIYGLTECAPFLCTTPAYFEMKHQHTTAGYPIDGVQVALLDDQHRKITATGQVGQIYVKGPVVFGGYYHDPVKTKQTLTSSGWLKTGDLGHWNHDQALVVDGRSKDIIIRGGENISAYVIERELLRHPHIKDAAAVGLKDNRLGQIIGVFIVTTPSDTALTLTMIKNFLDARGVAKKFWPEKVKIVTELPRTSSGKIKKRQLVLAAESNGQVLTHDRPGHDSGWGVTMEA